MSKAIKLEQAFHEVIMNILSNEEDVNAAKEYFENVSVNKLIEAACGPGVAAGEAGVQRCPTKSSRGATRLIRKRLSS